MILKSLILQGFKSFPERTVINFHKGVTAIVGPNGSGKSNITDAIRWVLGEQSVKTLRSNKMEELIFSGTSTRRALSYAEVSLVMDNSDKVLGLDYEEIRVSRRIYRSGESEYLINNNKCRLKDITELFLDTGIGRDGYSMIGQGRVDDILSGKAELRRRMIDEASGITKYKIRKEEAEKKLAYTEQNLVRINDILSEVEKQRAPLERQAKKARTFLALHEEAKALDLALLYHDIDEKESLKKDFQLAKLDLDEKLSDANAQKEQILASSSESRSKLQELSQTIEHLQNEEQEVRKSIYNFEQEKALAKQKLEDIANRRERFLLQSSELNERLEKLVKEREDKSASLIVSKQDIQLLEKQLAEIESQIQAIVTQQNKEKAAKQEHEQKVSSLQLNMKSLELQRQSEFTNLEVLRSHHKILKRDLEQVDQDLSQELTKQSELQENLDKTLSQKKLVEENLRDFDRERELLRVRNAELETQLNAIKSEIHNLSYQKKTQEELQESYEGYSYSVKHIMEYSKSDSKVHGPLADLLQVPKDYEVAIETVLGGSAQHIVVDNENIAKNLIQTLKQKSWGRASFYPLNQMNPSFPPHNLLNQVSTMPGYLGLASDLVTFSETIRPAAEYALARTVVVDTLEHGVDMAKAIGFKIRICSLEGDLLNPGGSMSGGSRKQSSSGFLSRRRLLDDIEHKLSAFENNLIEKSSEWESAKKKFQELDLESNELMEKLALLSREEILLDSHAKQYQQSQAKLSSQHEQNEADLSKLDSEIEAIEKSLEVLDTDIKSIQDEMDRINEILQKSSLNTSTDENTLDALQNKRLDLKTSLSEKKAWAESNVALLQRVKTDIKQIEEENIQRVEDTKVQEAESKRLRMFLDSGDSRFTELTQVEVALQERIKQAKERQVYYSEVMEDSNKQMETISAYLSKLGLEQGRLEQKEENNNQSLMNYRARLWEEYAQTFANRDQWHQEDLNLSQSRTHLKALRQSIKDLGNVNVQAIEESQEINERFLFMDKQREDIVSAQKDLQIVINDIVRGMKEQFTKSFALISEQFTRIFKDLFGGGEAELVLDDSSDILNSNIDIKVSPPGKRLQNMLALSGGERCLTAIALLFAIQKLNPSPFCVLDEVEAALDEANVFRFTDYIVNNSSDTQYILVTHRRGTMEAARMIYGVTMQERGVSSIISVKLEEGE